MGLEEIPIQSYWRFFHCPILSRAIVGSMQSFWFLRWLSSCSASCKQQHNKRGGVLLVLHWGLTLWRRRWLAVGVLSASCRIGHLMKNLFLLFTDESSIRIWPLLPFSFDDLHLTTTASRSLLDHFLTLFLLSAPSLAIQSVSWLTVTQIDTISTWNLGILRY